MAKTSAKAPTAPGSARADAGGTGTKAWVILRGYNSAVELAADRPEFEHEDNKPEARVFGPFSTGEHAQSFRERMMRRNPAGRDTGEVR